MRYVEIYGFNGRENGGIARLTVVGFRFREKTYPHKTKRTFHRWFWYASKEYGFAVLTN